jgi:hypothetical protein
MVAVTFVVAGTVGGASAGLAAGIVAAPVRVLGRWLGEGLTASPPPAGLVVIGLVAAGLALDGWVLVAGRPVPIASGRQVPPEWGRLLPAPVAAVLYGARLGVGPLTILSTWTWWSFTLAAAAIGSGPSVLAGSAFGALRTAVVAGVSLPVHGPGQAGRLAALRSRQRAGWIGLNGAGLAGLAAAALVVAGCSSSSPPAAPAPLPARPPVTAAAASRSPPAAPGGDGTGTGAGAQPWTTEAHLEDAVQRSPNPTRPPASSGGTTRPRPHGLPAVLLDTIDGFEPIGGPEVDRPLDLLAAAELQPDPPEEVALLETRGFEAGWTRAFRSAAGDVAVASVYQFADSGEAAFYLEDGLITIGGYGGRLFDVAGQPGVRGFRQTFTAGGDELVSLGAAFTAGDRWFLVYLVGSPETVTDGVLLPAIADQVHLATGHQR